MDEMRLERAVPKAFILLVVDDPVCEVEERLVSREALL
jgi:hypothetical protein